jgi:hypothetical protein
MLNEMLTRCLQFCFKFCETVFQSPDGVQRKVIRRIGGEAIMLTFGIIGIAFATLCVLGSLSSSVREPSI